MNLSAVVLTKNNEKEILYLLSNLSFCDEIIIVDDNSTDNTAVLARGKGAKVFDREMNGDFSAQRNFGLGKAFGRWVLFVDADETISKSLKEEIRKYTNKATGYSGFYLKRRDKFFGKYLEYGECGSIKLLRLGLKNKGIWKRKVHETWEIEGNKETLKGNILHKPHDNLKSFISKINFYSSLHATENFKEGKKSSVFKIIFFPIVKFIYNYLFKLGFLDGDRGFVFALFMSLHSFLSWSKLWTMTTKIKL